MLLWLLGILPAVVVGPGAAASIIVGTGGMILLQRRLAAIPIGTGPEALVGARGEALTAVAGRGRVRIGSETWNARSVEREIPAGAEVRVERIDGMAAIVSQAKLDDRR